MIATIVGVLLGFLLSVFMDILKNIFETSRLNTYANYLLTDTFKIMERTLINIENNSKHGTFEEFNKESLTNKRVLEYNITCLNDIEIANLRSKELIRFSMSKRLIVNMIRELKEDMDRVEDEKSLKIFISNLSISIEIANKLANNRKIVIDELVNELRL
ncbi:hypothetical protein CM318V1_210100 [Carnobacterium maltaromaticum]|uniref:hypothetical protein n=1 Tax=Carnobacterium maltaromaticum TaxID=2751 RepID=UPI000704C1B3|nr:hypothetical protein [Carnobacterium maltaromaticum]CRH18081.1 hypothetical protein CM318V1_210100 [Carnobacterium maltaromaticum]